MLFLIFLSGFFTAQFCTVQAVPNGISDVDDEGRPEPPIVVTGRLVEPLPERHYLSLTHGEREIPCATKTTSNDFRCVVTPNSDNRELRSYLLDLTIFNFGMHPNPENKDVLRHFWPRILYDARIFGSGPIELVVRNMSGTVLPYFRGSIVAFVDLRSVPIQDSVRLVDRSINGLPLVEYRLFPDTFVPLMPRPNLVRGKLTIPVDGDSEYRVQFEIDRRDPRQPMRLENIAEILEGRFVLNCRDVEIWQALLHLQSEKQLASAASKSLLGRHFYTRVEDGFFSQTSRRKKDKKQQKLAHNEKVLEHNGKLGEENLNDETLLPLEEGVVKRSTKKRAAPYVIIILEQKNERGKFKGIQRQRMKRIGITKQPPK